MIRVSLTSPTVGGVYIPTMRGDSLWSIWKIFKSLPLTRSSSRPFLFLILPFLFVVVLVLPYENNMSTGSLARRYYSLSPFLYWPIDYSTNWRRNRADKQPIREKGKQLAIHRLKWFALQPPTVCALSLYYVVVVVVVAVLLLLLLLSIHKTNKLTSWHKNPSTRLLLDRCTRRRAEGGRNRLS